MTREELREKVMLNIGGRMDKTTVINDALEQGLKLAVDLHSFRALRSEGDVDIVENDKSVNLPVNTFQLIEARLVDGVMSYPITIKDKKWLVDRWSNVEDVSTGKPVYGYVEGNVLYLYPVSNGSYTIRITVCINPSFIDADITENPIPCIDMALVYFGTAQAMRNLQMFDYADQWERQFNNALIAAKVGDERTSEEIKLEPFGAKVAPQIVIEPYLDPFARRSI